MLLDGILIKCSKNIKSSRSIAAIYHLLTGKKSIQTVQDAHIYDLKNFYGIYYAMNKKTFDAKMNQLIHRGLLYTCTSSACIPSKVGEKWLAENEDKLLFNRFNGIKYHAVSPVFSDRLLLLIQTLTNKKHGSRFFIPIIEKKEIQLWMKHYYKRQKSLLQQNLSGLHREMHAILSCLPNWEANFFVDHLTGYKIYGRSTYQLSEHFNMELCDVHLTWTRIIHQILQMVQKDPLSYPVLNAVRQDIAENKSLITNSADRTYQLLSKNYTLDQISGMRMLKLNTIHDHVVEIALLTGNFPIFHYVTEKQYTDIVQAIAKTTTFSLKQLKQMVDEDISYFQIRLVLAASKTRAKAR